MDVNLSTNSNDNLNATPNINLDTNQNPNLTTDSFINSVNVIPSNGLGTNSNVGFNNNRC